MRKRGNKRRKRRGKGAIWKRGEENKRDTNSIATYVGSKDAAHGVRHACVPNLNRVVPAAGDDDVRLRRTELERKHTACVSCGYVTMSVFRIIRECDVARVVFSFFAYPPESVAARVRLLSSYNLIYN